jgi:hypothetical protein
MWLRHAFSAASTPTLSSNQEKKKTGATLIKDA